VAVVVGLEGAGTSPQARELCATGGARRCGFELGHRSESLMPTSGRLPCRWPPTRQARCARDQRCPPRSPSRIWPCTCATSPPAWPSTSAFAACVASTAVASRASLQDPDGSFVEFSYGQPLGPGAEALDERRVTGSAGY
jgi:hypothetical protein